MTRIPLVLPLALLVACGSPASGSCTVVEGDDGSATITCPDGTTATVHDGEDGAPGTNGAAGADGEGCSVEREADEVVVSCPDGSSASVTDGQDGVDGADGSNGTPGHDGADGVGCTVTSNGDGTSTITCGATQATVRDGLSDLVLVTGGRGATSQASCETGFQVVSGGVLELGLQVDVTVTLDVNASFGTDAQPSGPPWDPSTSRGAYFEISSANSPLGIAPVEDVHGLGSGFEATATLEDGTPVALRWTPDPLAVDEASGADTGVYRTPGMTASVGDVELLGTDGFVFVLLLGEVDRYFVTTRSFAAAPLFPDEMARLRAIETVSPDLSGFTVDAVCPANRRCEATAWAICARTGG